MRRTSPTTRHPRPVASASLAWALERGLALLLAAFGAAALQLPAAGQGCSGGAGSCITPHPGPGCSDVECCNAVCPFDPHCCDTEWDAACVAAAEVACLPLGVCGLSTAGDCFEIHQNPACADESCCTQVCAQDPPCCDASWDSLCVQRAYATCSTPAGCGGIYPCSEPHPQGGCSDVECCTLICGFDPHCCNVAWDGPCVAAYNCYCAGNCNVVCPANAVAELEPCGQKKNDPCYNPGATIQGQSAVPGLSMCASLFANTIAGGGIDADVDVFVAQLGNAGSGQITATLSLTSKIPVWAALVPAPPIGGCNPLSMAVMHVTSINTIPASQSLCIPAGKYWIVATAGTYPAIGQVEPFACGLGSKYLVKVSYVPGCAAVCGDPASPCFIPHPQPGCGDPSAECCLAVCDVDPFCCNAEWDNACAVEAANLCGALPPENDDCGAAIPLAAGVTPFSTVSATTDGPALPPACDQGSGTDMDADVWFVYAPTGSGTVEISTCGDTGFDVRLAVYEGTDCPPSTVVACNDDDPACPSGAANARVWFGVRCGQHFLVRVGGDNGDRGVGTLTLVETFTAACCEGDINGDGQVNGADLGLLIGNWGGAGTGDLNGDGTVNGADLGILIGHWGPCPA